MEIVCYIDETSVVRSLGKNEMVKLARKLGPLEHGPSVSPSTMASDTLLSSSSPEDWMRHALIEAEIAITEGEVPVGAVFVAHKVSGSEMDFTTGSIVSRGHNLTNRTRNVCNPPTSRRFYL